MAFYNEFPGTRSYDGDLLWLINQIKELAGEFSQISQDMEELKKYIKDYFIEEKLTEEVRRTLEEWLEDGTIEALVGQYINLESKLYNMQQITPSDQFEIDLDYFYNFLTTNYADNELFRWELIGRSVNNVPIYDFIIGKLGNNPFNKAIVFANHHAKEHQNVYSLFNQIRYIMDNMETGSVAGEKLTTIFNDCELHCILTINPDGYKLITDPTSLYQLDSEHQALIIDALESFIQRGALTVNLDVTQAEYDEILAYSGGNFSGYKFRLQDLHIWKANLNGVDLHYNCYTSSSNETYVRNYIADPDLAKTFQPQIPSPANYIGTSGFSEPENIALYNLITTQGIKYAVSLHQRGPTMFYLYKYGVWQAARNMRIAADMGAATQTPTSRRNNGPVGFAGWFYDEFSKLSLGGNKWMNNWIFSCIKETGWGTTDRYLNGIDVLDGVQQVCPLPNSTNAELFENEKNCLLLFCQRYVRKMDCNESYMQLTQVDIYGNANRHVTADQILFTQDVYDRRNRTAIPSGTGYPAADSIALKDIFKSTDVNGSRIVAYLSTGSYPGITRPTTGGGSLVGLKSGNQTIFYWHPLGTTAIYYCTGQISTGNVTNWQRVTLTAV